jgi:Family of unknown function (DUF5670)
VYQARYVLSFRELKVPRDSGRFGLDSWLRWKQSQRVFPRKDENMLWTIFVILLVLWLLGLVTSYTLGGFVHILLVLAVVVLLIRLLQGRTVV